MTPQPALSKHQNVSCSEMMISELNMAGHAEHQNNE